MTRKFVYDARRARVRMVAWTTGSHAVVHRSMRPLRWPLLVALMIGASALAFHAAHVVAQARGGATSAR